ncbi:MAG: 3-phosphoshikimate 1-carboxyvinyltransferase [Verrucomicrobia bacterium]|nr:3-phosphoshikimate 1-carboxyvinyltransferase [Verrucomicrobiota bacterium]
MASLRVRKAPRISAEIRVPGDKSISHRAVMLASLSNGTCVLRGFLPGEDCLATVNALRALGVDIEQPEPTTLIVRGARRKLAPAGKPIDCGNSGTTMRLLAGLLAGQEFTTTLVGDPSLSRRPMRRVIEPLTLMGGRLLAHGEKDAPPLEIVGQPLRGTEYRLPIASAQIKSCVLLAGLFAEGRTTVIESAPSRDHTERLLDYFLVPLQREMVDVDGKRESRLTIEGGAMPESRDFNIPGDISGAAFWLAAAAAQPGAHLLVKDVGLNDTRTGILSVLLRMGARVREVVESIDQIERIGSIEIAGGELRGTVIEGGEIPNVIDELPIIAVLGALAEGETIIRDAAELRVKETDRLAALAANLRAMGGEVEEQPDGLVIQGGRPLKGATLPSFGDHRIAMAFAIAGLFASGETVIEDTDCIATSYPGFEETLQRVLELSVEGEAPTPVISTAPPT